jgi:hypothetical protein
MPKVHSPWMIFGKTCEYAARQQKTRLSAVFQKINNAEWLCFVCNEASGSTRLEKLSIKAVCYLRNKKNE